MPINVTKHRRINGYRVDYHIHGKELNSHQNCGLVSCIDDIPLAELSQFIAPKVGWIWSNHSFLFHLGAKRGLFMIDAQLHAISSQDSTDEVDAWHEQLEIAKNTPQAMDKPATKKTRL